MVDPKEQLEEGELFRLEGYIRRVWGAQLRRTSEEPNDSTAVMEMVGAEFLRRC